MKKVRPFRGHGTTIFFRPDDEIFRRVQFIAETIRQHLEDISYIHGGLRITFVDAVKNETVELFHADGIAGFLEKLTAETQKRPAHEQVFAAERDKGTTRVEVVLRWTESTDEN